MVGWTSSDRAGAQHIYDALLKPKLSMILCYHIYRTQERFSKGGADVSVIDWQAEDDNSLTPKERFSVLKAKARKAGGGTDASLEGMGAMEDYFDVVAEEHITAMDEVNAKLIHAFQDAMFEFITRNGGRMAGKGDIKGYAWNKFTTGAIENPDETGLLTETDYIELLESALASLEFDGRAIFDVDINAYVPVGMVPLEWMQRGWVIAVNRDGRKVLGMVYDVDAADGKLELKVNFEKDGKGIFTVVKGDDPGLRIWLCCGREVTEKRIQEWERSGEILTFAREGVMSRDLAEMKKIENKGTIYHLQTKRGWRKLKDTEIDKYVKRARAGAATLRKTIGTADPREAQKILQFGIGGLVERNIAIFVPERYDFLYHNVTGEGWSDMLQKKVLERRVEDNLVSFVELSERIQMVETWQQKFESDILDLLGMEKGLTAGYINQPAIYQDEFEAVIKRLKTAYDSYMESLAPEQWSDWQREIALAEEAKETPFKPPDKRFEQYTITEGVSVIDAALEKIEGMPESDLNEFIEKLKTIEALGRDLWGESKNKVDSAKSRVIDRLVNTWAAGHEKFIYDNLTLFRSLLEPYPDEWAELYAVYIGISVSKIHALAPPHMRTQYIDDLRQNILKERLSTKLKGWLNAKIDQALQSMEKFRDAGSVKKPELVVPVALPAAIKSKDRAAEREVISDLLDAGTQIKDLQELSKRLPDIVSAAREIPRARPTDQDDKSIKEALSIISGMPENGLNDQGKKLEAYEELEKRLDEMFFNSFTKQPEVPRLFYQQVEGPKNNLLSRIAVIFINAEEIPMDQIRVALQRYPGTVKLIAQGRGEWQPPVEEMPSIEETFVDPKGAKGAVEELQRIREGGVTPEQPEAPQERGQEYEGARPTRGGGPSSGGEITRVGITRRICPRCGSKERVTYFWGPDDATIRQLMKIINYPNLYEYLTVCPSCKRNMGDWWNTVALVERLDWLIQNEETKGTHASARKLRELQTLLVEASTTEEISPREQITPNAKLYLAQMFMNNIVDFLKEGGRNFYLRRALEIERVLNGLDIQVVADFMVEDIWNSFVRALNQGRGVTRQFVGDVEYQRMVLDSILSAYTRTLLIMPLFTGEGVSHLEQYRDMKMFPQLQRFMRQHEYEDFEPERFFNTVVSLMRLRS